MNTLKYPNTHFKLPFRVTSSQTIPRVRTYAYLFTHFKYFQLRQGVPEAPLKREEGERTVAWITAKQLGISSIFEPRAFQKLTLQTSTRGANTSCEEGEKFARKFPDYNKSRLGGMNIYMPPIPSVVECKAFILPLHSVQYFNEQIC